MDVIFILCNISTCIFLFSREDEIILIKNTQKIIKLSNINIFIDIILYFFIKLIKKQLSCYDRNVLTVTVFGDTPLHPMEKSSILSLNSRIILCKLYALLNS